MTSLISLMPASTALKATKCACGRLGDQARERGLAGAGRAPEDDRLQQVALDGLAQRLPGRQQILLADELVERARPHALGERRAARPGPPSRGRRGKDPVRSCACPGPALAARLEEDHPCCHGRIQ